MQIHINVEIHNFSCQDQQQQEERNQWINKEEWQDNKDLNQEVEEEASVVEEHHVEDFVVHPVEETEEAPDLEDVEVQEVVAEVDIDCDILSLHSLYIV